MFFRDGLAALGVNQGEDDRAVLACLLETIRRLRVEVGLGRSLGDLGVTRADIPRLAELAMKDPCLLTNPRAPTQKEIEAIYEAAL